MSSPQIPISLDIIRFPLEYPNENISQENTNTLPLLGHTHPRSEVGVLSTED